MSGYRIELWVLVVAIAALLLLAVEGGFRLGRRVAARRSEASRAEMTTIQSAILGLLALLLGFSFAMAEARYQTRRDLVLAESNAIGTTFLRAALLPDPPRAEIAQLLERYVDARIAFHAAGSNRARLRRASSEAEELQAQLWARGAEAAALDVRATTTALFLQSLNEVIDTHAKRIVALENRVPQSILLLLVFVAIISCGLIGYGNGLGGARNFVVSLVTVIVFCAVMVMIVDLDRPDRGLVRVPQQSMLRLRRSLG
ncbi:MAG: bestrophin-like domain, partial [Polyangia bacterium]